MENIVGLLWFRFLWSQFAISKIYAPWHPVESKNLRENAQYCALPAHLYASFPPRKASPNRGQAALACLEFESLGLDVTTAIRLFLKQAINQRCIPFDIVPPQREFSDSTLAAIEEAKKLARNPKAKRYSSAKELLEDCK
ncbi:type II toxin-antitoxin system RelB/DinJ family antitoxin [Candidatus Saccharibacteria bacterium]|nr:type II toxin-antitoxin system RelB/DinJ family antitoxin [Candidatus Saccharibacteria bacterium]